MRQEMAACFSHKANKATIVHALQQLKIQKDCVCWVTQQLMKEH